MLGLLVTKVFAQDIENANGAVRLLYKFNEVIINPLIQLFFAVAFLVFLFGFIEFFFSGGSPEKTSTGKKHMLWGLVGLFIMISAVGILNLFLQFIGAPFVIVG